MVNEALKKIEPLLSCMYRYAAEIKGGRPSIAPEKLLRAMLLQIFYSVRSERLLMEQTQYNLLFRWFIGPKNLQIREFGVELGRPVHGQQGLGVHGLHQNPRSLDYT
jgi:transposase